MARQGGDVATTTGVTIPSDTSTVTLPGVEGGFPTELGSVAMPGVVQGVINPVEISGVQGTIAWTGSEYTFARTDAGATLAIDRPTPIITLYDREQTKDEIMIIFMGQNDETFDTAAMVAKHQLMIQHFPGKKFLILGLHTGNAASRADHETAMTAAFGRRFISIRKYLVAYGLEDTGLAATTDDTNAIAIGQVPPQLLLDGTHYIPVARTAIGHMLSRNPGFGTSLSLRRGPYVLHSDSVHSVA